MRNEQELTIQFNMTNHEMLSTTTSNDYLEESNPFRIPSDEEVFMMRDEEKRKKREDRIKLIQAPVHEKTTWSTRLTVKRHFDRDIDRKLRESTRQRAMKLPSIQKEKQEKEHVTQFIDKKRQMFLLTMSLETKKQEIKKIEKIAEEKERKLQAEELALKREELKFEDFLSNNNLQTAQAITRAEEETKAKQQKQNEIKKLNSRRTAVKTEMQKLRYQLEKCQQYKHFLDGLTPQNWFDLLNERNERRKRELVTNNPPSARKMSIVSSKTTMVQSLDQEGVEDPDSEFEMYFKKPEQLLTLFSDLEEENLRLMQSSEESQEQLEEIQKTEREYREKMDKQVEEISKQLEAVSKQTREEAEQRDIMEKRLMSRNKRDNSERLNQLKNQIQEIFESYCDGSVATEDPDPILMLTLIEKKIEHLLSELDGANHEVILRLERARDRARRKEDRELKNIMRNNRLNESKKNTPTPLFETRSSSALSLTRRNGRPLMIRSKPYDEKKRVSIVEETPAEKEETKKDEFKELFS